MADGFGPAVQLGVSQGLSRLRATDARLPKAAIPKPAHYPFPAAGAATFVRAFGAALNADVLEPRLGSLPRSG